MWEVVVLFEGVCVGGRSFRIKRIRKKGSMGGELIVRGGVLLDKVREGNRLGFVDVYRFC